jgi:hypothetical protein
LGLGAFVVTKHVLCVSVSDTEDHKPVDSAAALDIDLYCLNCGYNLRGLSGNPIRCPECFHENARADLHCPPAEVQRRVRRMHRWADFCVLVAFLIIISLVSAALQRELSCLACGMVVLPVVWAGSAIMFERACLSQAGWLGILLRASMYGALWAIGSTVCLALTALAAWALFGSDARSVFGIPLFWVLAAIVAIIGGFVVAGRGYGRRIDELEGLARNAVRLEREELRRQAGGQ